MKVQADIDFTTDGIPEVGAVILNIKEETIKSLVQAQDILFQQNWNSITVEVDSKDITLLENGMKSTYNIVDQLYKITKYGVYFMFTSKEDSTATYITERLSIRKNNISITRLSKTYLVENVGSIGNTCRSWALSKKDYSAVFIGNLEKNINEGKHVDEILNLATESELIPIIQSFYI